MRGDGPIRAVSPFVSSSVICKQMAEEGGSCDIQRRQTSVDYSNWPSVLNPQTLNGQD